MKGLFPKMTTALLLTSSVFGMERLQKHPELRKDVEEHNQKMTKQEEMFEEFGKSCAGFTACTALIAKARKLGIKQDVGAAEVQTTQLREELEQSEAFAVLTKGPMMVARGELKEVQRKLDAAEKELKELKAASTSGSSRVVPASLMLVVGGIMLVL